MRSASVFDTLFEGPRMCFGDLLSSDGSNENSTTSESSSTESLRNAERKSSFRNEMETGATSIQPVSSATDQNVRRSMTWSWNPHTMKKSSDGQKIANSDTDYLKHLSYDCYDQTLDRLMGEFNVNKVRKRNWNRNTDNNNRDGNYNSIIMSDGASGSENQQQQLQQNQRTKPNRNSSSDVEDVNFWTKVFFNNNNNDAPTTKKVQPNTAIIFNSIISNLNDHRTKTNGNSLNIVDPIETNAHNLNGAPKSNIEIDTLASAKLLTGCNNSKTTQNLSNCRNKNVTSTVHRQGESDDFNDDSNATNENSSIAQTTKYFLQTLNDLRLDYNDLSTDERCNTTRTSRPRSGHAKAKEAATDCERPNSS